MTGSACPSGPAEFSSPAEKIWGIEILRFASALAVLVIHYRQHYVAIFPEMSGMTLSLPTWMSILLWPFGFGSWAVSVFWILSGYIFYHTYIQTIHGGRVSWRKFFWHRFSRLYPLHLLTLLLVVLLQFALQAKTDLFNFSKNTPEKFALHLLMASNWFTSERTFNVPIWSVSVEVLVYAGFFVFAKKLGPRILPVALLILPCLWLNQYKRFEGGIIECALFFFTGGLGWLLEQKVGQGLRLKVALAGVLGIILCWCLGWMNAPKTAILLGVPCLIVCLKYFFMKQERFSPFARRLGNLTYSSYLLHYPFSLLMVWIVLALGIAPDLFLSPWVFGGIILMVLVLSHFCYEKFENPCQVTLRKIQPNPGNRRTDSSP